MHFFSPLFQRLPRYNGTWCILGKTIAKNKILPYILNNLSIYSLTYVFFLILFITTAKNLTNFIIGTLCVLHRTPYSSVINIFILLELDIDSSCF